MMMIVSSSVAMLCVITLSLLLTISADHASIHDPQLHELLGAASDYQQLHHPALPRKLMVLNKKGEDYDEAKSRLQVSSNQQNKPAYSGRRREEVKVRVHANAEKAGTREEWMEEGSDHEFFTMDYSHVRRRRPIHNKSLIPAMTNVATTSHP